VASVDLATEVLNEEQQILGPLTERRHRQHDTPEPVEEILSEPLLASDAPWDGFHIPRERLRIVVEAVLLFAGAPVDLARSQSTMG
jgi:hypothetical protein